LGSRPRAAGSAAQHQRLHLAAAATEVGVRPPVAPFDPDHLLRLSLTANSARDLELSLADGGDVAWLRAPNADLEGRPPLAVLVEDGLPGLARVFLHLRDWALGGDG
jgi:hypothetical protein